jgi:hypothetical protein
LALTTVLLLLSVAVPAQAYTDPGSGALIWQMLAAGFVGFTFYLRRMITWFKAKRNVEQREVQ